MSDILGAAEAWIAGDPDPSTRAELEGLISDGDLEELKARFSGDLTFGTAGIRGEVGAGPSRMNRAVVIRTTSGLAAYLHANRRPGPVIVGFDARPTSATFAEDVAGVLAATGFEVRFFPEYTPTPLVAFTAKHLNASAAVVVTASHNPPADNGYKVYDSNSAQIIPPADGDIAAAIDRVGPANQVARVVGVFEGVSDAVRPVSEDLLRLYWEEVEKCRPDPQQSDMRIVYTPIHGVGAASVKYLFEQAGHTGLVLVPEQAAPDGLFPTVSFPNPEEPGSLDLALDMATEIDAHLILANDPDADRLAAAVPTDGGWRLLSGNEIGVLLGDYVLRHWSEAETPIVMNSIVSSPMLGRLASLHRATHEVTLTGFKWIINAALALEQEGEGRFAFGFEEALGYSIGPTVRDKDGMSAALIFSDLVAGLRTEGRTVIDRLEELWGQVGVWVSAQHSLVRQGDVGVAAISNAVATLADSPPGEVSGYRVEGVRDFRSGGENRPFWLGNQSLVEMSLADVGRVLVRPSGTEPKLKIYVDLTAPATSDVTAQRGELQMEAKRLAAEVAELLAI